MALRLFPCKILCVVKPFIVTGDNNAFDLEFSTYPKFMSDLQTSMPDKHATFLSVTNILNTPIISCNLTKAMVACAILACKNCTCKHSLMLPFFYFNRQLTPIFSLLSIRSAIPSHYVGTRFRTESCFILNKLSEIYHKISCVYSEKAQVNVLCYSGSVLMCFSFPHPKRVRVPNHCRP